MTDLNPLVAYEDDPVADTVHHPYSAYNQGWDARGHGHSLTANPYEDGTREEHWWSMGWVDRDDRSEGWGGFNPPSLHDPVRRRLTARQR